MTHTPFRTILASSIALALFAPAAGATTYTWDATGDALGLIAGGGELEFERRHELAECGDVWRVGKHECR